MGRTRSMTLCRHSFYPFQRRQSRDYKITSLVRYLFLHLLILRKVYAPLIETTILTPPPLSLPQEIPPTSGNSTPVVLLICL